MYLADMIQRIRILLSDEAETLLSEPVVVNCIESAVSDLTRVYPLKKKYDVTLSWTITNEAITSHATVKTTAISLAHQMIKSTSEVVTNAAGTVTYTRDTDYTMDYANGKITPISAGAMAINTAYLIDYTKMKIGFSIASIIDELIAPLQVEYPFGEVPQKTVSFERYYDYIVIGSSDSGSQATLSEYKHAVLYYTAEHTPPTSTAIATYPRYLDNAIIVGAESYIYEYLMGVVLAAVKTDITTLKTTADTIESDPDTPLGTAATLMTGIAAKLTLAATAMTAIGTRVTAGVVFLTSGTAKLDVVNKGANVGENYATYADKEGSFALMYSREAEGRIADANAIIAEAARYIDSAAIYFQKANAKAQGYVSAIEHGMELAKQYSDKSALLRAEFWAILKDKLQLKTNMPTVPLLQGVKT